MILELNDFRFKKVQLLMKKLYEYEIKDERIYIRPQIGGFEVMEVPRSGAASGTRLSVVLTRSDSGNFIHVGNFLTLYHASTFYGEVYGPNPFTEFFAYLNEVTFDRDRVGNYVMGVQDVS